MVRPPTLLNTLTQEHVPALCMFPFLTEVEDAEEEGFRHPPLVKSIRTHNPHHRAISYDNIRWKWPKKFLPLYGLENDRRAFGCPGCISYRGSCRARNGPWRGFGSRGSERSPRWGGLAHWPLGELSDMVRPKLVSASLTRLFFFLLSFLDLISDSIHSFSICIHTHTQNLERTVRYFALSVAAYS